MATKKNQNTGRRENGTGTIYQRETGSWVGKISLDIDTSGYYLYSIEG